MPERRQIGVGTISRLLEAAGSHHSTGRVMTINNSIAIDGMITMLETIARMCPDKTARIKVRQAAMALNDAKLKGIMPSRQ